jgi:DNA-binding beta-propeller fold protein YncE
MLHLRGVGVACVIGAAAVLSVGCAAESLTDEGAFDGEENVEKQAQELSCGGETLYIGDDGDDTVKRFDAKTGAFKGTFVTSGSGGLSGPRGLVFGHSGDLVVVNQNFGASFPGELFTYDKKTGAFEGALVSRTNPKAPFAPRGVAKKGDRLYVADMGEPDFVFDGGPGPNPLPGRVAVYDAKSGAYKSDLAYAGFNATCSAGSCVEWAPRGIAFGTGNAVYVTAMQFTTNDDPNTLNGRIIRFSEKGVPSVFVDGDTCNCGLARPEGLAFGPNNKLYVTSFRTSVNDTDKILIFNGKTGAFEGKIDLYQVGQQRAYAQALAFGPGEKLYVPITGGGPDAGSVRRYDVKKKTYDVVVAPGGHLNSGWYLAFGK